MPPNSSMMTIRPFSVDAADTKGLWTSAARPTTRKGIPFSPYMLLACYGGGSLVCKDLAARCPE
eukprot:4483107-Amphidinium_carterae.1